MTKEQPAHSGSSASEDTEADLAALADPARAVLAIEGRASAGEGDCRDGEKQRESGARGLVPYGPLDLLRAMERTETPVQVSVTSLQSLLGRSRS